jgi:pyridoxine 5'-phosphate synthase PdxJ
MSKEVPDFGTPHVPSIQVQKPEDIARDIAGMEVPEFGTPHQPEVPEFGTPHFSTAQKIGGGLKMLGKGLTSIVAQPAQYVQRVGSTIGEHMANFVQETAKNMGLDEELKKSVRWQANLYGLDSPEKAQNLLKTWEKPNAVFQTLTFDEKGRTDAYDNWKDFGLDTVEATLNMGVALAPTASVFKTTAAIKPLVGKMIAGQVLSKAEKAIVTAGVKRIAMTAGMDTLFGAGFGGVTAARENMNIKKGALTGAGFGLLFPIAGSVILRAGSRMGIGMAMGLTKGGQLLQKVAERPQRTGLNAIANAEKKSFGSMMANTLDKTGKFMEATPAWIEDKWIDSFGPVRRIEKQIETSIGRKLTTEESAYVRARLGLGRASGLAKDKMLAFNDIINVGLDEKVNTYMLGKDLEWRYKRGQDIVKDVLPDGKGTQQDAIKQVVKDLEELGANPQFAEIEKLALMKKQFMDKMLDEKAEAGIITRELAEELKAKPMYVPHVVLDAVAPEFKQSGGGSGFSLRETGLKKAVGSERRIGDVNAGIQQLILLDSQGIARKEVMDAVWSLHQSLGDNSPFKIIRNADNVKQRQAYYQELHDLRLKLNSLNRELKTSGKIDRKKQTEVARLERELAELEGDLTAKTNQFFDETERYTPRADMDQIQKLPRELYYLQKDIQQFKTYSSFKKSNVGLKEFENGTLERHGIKSLRELWDRGISTHIITPEGVTTKTVPSAAELADLAKKTEQTGIKMSDARDIDLASIDDYIKELKRNVEIVQGRRTEIFDMVKGELADENLTALQKADANMDVISRVRDGIREDMLVPRDYAEAIKMTNMMSFGELANVWQVAAWISGAKILRPLVTTFSPAFAILRNPLRDVQTASMIAKHGMTPQDWAHGLHAAATGKITKDNDLYKLAQKQGVFIGTIYDEGRTGNNILRGIPLKTEKSHPTSRAVSIAASPATIVREVGLTMEEATRLAVFQRALKSGETPMSAAFQARNATVDFQKMGSWMKYLNQVIPFLNARVQGTINTLTAAASDPYAMARRQMYLSVYPTLKLYANNSRYTSYYTISDRLKMDNWIIMVGETKGVDSEGYNTIVPHYITIPKSETTKALSGSLERYFDLAAGQDVEGWGDFISQMAGAQSPISETDALPPILSTMFENKVNYDLFREKEIVPKFMQKAPVNEQYYEDTNEIYKQIGNMLGVSPLKVEFSIGNIFGPTPSDIMDTRSLILEGFANEGYKKVPDDPFEHWSQIPVIDSVIRTSNYRESPSLKEAQKAAEERRASVMLQVNRDTAQYIRDNDLMSIRVYFQKNAGAFANDNELNSAIMNTMKNLVQRNLPGGEYRYADGEGLYYLYYEDVISGKKNLQQITNDAFNRGAAQTEINKMLDFFLTQ